MGRIEEAASRANKGEKIDSIEDLWLDSVKLRSLTEEDSQDLQKMPHLHVLTMNMCQLSDLSRLPKMPNLTDFELNDNKLQLNSIGIIAEQCPNLKSLKMACNRLKASPEELCAAFGTLQFLEEVDFGENPGISDDDAGFRAAVFAQCKQPLKVVNGFLADGQAFNDVYSGDEEEPATHDDVWITHSPVLST